MGIAQKLIDNFSEKDKRKLTKIEKILVKNGMKYEKSVPRKIIAQKSHLVEQDKSPKRG